MQDKYGLVPDEIKAMYQNVDSVERQLGTRDWLNRELQARDRYLSVVFVKPDVSEWDLPAGAIPARWHVKRDNPDFIPTYWPIVGPNGEFREPSAHVLEEVAQRDLHNESTMHQLRTRQARVERENDKQRALEAEQRRDELALDLRAGKRVAGDGGLTKRKWDKGRKK